MPGGRPTVWRPMECHTSTPEEISGYPPSCTVGLPAGGSGSMTQSGWATPSVTVAEGWGNTRREVQRDLTSTRAAARRWDTTPGGGMDDVNQLATLGGQFEATPGWGVGPVSAATSGFTMSGAMETSSASGGEQGELLRGRTDFGSENRGRSAVLEVERRAVPATSGSDTLPTTVGPGLGLGAGQATAASGGSVAAGGAGVPGTVSLAVPLLGHLPQIPKFSGDIQDGGETFLEWLEQFKLVGWNDHWKLVHLTSNLRGTAAAFHRSCGVEVRSQYKSLVEAMKRRFTPVHLTAVQTQLFHARQQAEGETVEQFAQFNQA